MVHRQAVIIAGVRGIGGGLNGVAAGESAKMLPIIRTFCFFHLHAEIWKLVEKELFFANAEKAAALSFWRRTLGRRLNRFRRRRMAQLISWGKCGQPFKQPPLHGSIGQAAELIGGWSGDMYATRDLQRFDEMRGESGDD
jgi:hypothetical protein